MLHISKPRRISASICSSPSATGIFCTDEGAGSAAGPGVTRFYFDTRIGSCQQFSYRGCGGNGNNFFTIEECQTFCTSGRTRPSHIPVDSGGKTRRGWLWDPSLRPKVAMKIHSRNDIKIVAPLSISSQRAIYSRRRAISFAVPSWTIWTLPMGLFLPVYRRSKRLYLLQRCC